MSKLQDFQDLVNDLKDEELLVAAETLLREMGEIQNMQEKIEVLEEGLSHGNKAAFWFFAMGLDREQIDLATNTVIGRRRFLQDQLERAKVKYDIENPKLEESGEPVTKINDENELDSEE